MSTTVASVVITALSSVMRSWLLVFPLLFLRAAIAVTGFLPIVIAMSVLIKLLMSAPDSASQANPEMSVYFGQIIINEWSIASMAAVFTGVFVIQIVLEALIDGGLTGAFSKAAKKGTGTGLEEFAYMSINLFDRIVVIRTVMALLRLLFSTAVIMSVIWLASVFSVIYESPGQAGDFYLLSLIAGVSLAVIGVVYCTMTLWMYAAMSAVAVDNLDIVDSFVTGWKFLKSNIESLVLVCTFVASLGIIWFALEAAGAIWWFKLLSLHPEAAGIEAASMAWDITFSIMAQILAMLFLASLVVLYIERRERFVHPTMEKLVGGLQKMVRLA